MKWPRTFLFFISIHLVSGQPFPHRDLQSLVEAEEAFAQMAREKNTRDAFLFFFSDDAITNARGAGPRRGKKHLEEQTPNESLLSWHPVFSDISKSGDFGYNTGPWEFRQNRTDTDPVAYGEFVSMWKKNKQGEWKVAVDIGISHAKPGRSYTLTSSSVQPDTRNAASGEETLFNLERQVAERLSQQGNRAYRGLLSDEAKFFRPGEEPYRDKKGVLHLLRRSKGKVTYTFAGGDMAQAGDLAYVYGKATRVSFQNGVSRTSQHSYLRFWKKERDRWKIVLDLLSD